MAAALGHGSFKVTTTHYVQPGTLDGARTEQLMQLLSRTKTEQEPDPARLQMEQLLSTLPAETLARFIELARRTPSSLDLTRFPGQPTQEDTAPPSI